jgi:hypothetical protein
MTEQQRASFSPGVLLLGADWALAHGDADGLAHMVIALSSHARGLLAIELAELARLCGADFDAATRSWPEVRAAVCAELLPPSAHAAMA